MSNRSLSTHDSCVERTKCPAVASSRMRQMIWVDGWGVTPSLVLGLNFSFLSIRTLKILCLINRFIRLIALHCACSCLFYHQHRKSRIQTGQMDTCRLFLTCQTVSEKIQLNNDWYIHAIQSFTSSYFSPMCSLVQRLQVQRGTLQYTLSD